MKKLVEEVTRKGLEKLIGEKVLLMCLNYFYYGELIGVNSDCVLLKNPGIVYETGEWNKSNFSDLQSLGVKEWYVRISTIESFGVRNG